MTDALVRRFTDERETKVQVIQSIAQTADEEGRDLYDTEKATVKLSRARIAELDEQIDIVSGSLEMAQETRARVRALDPAIMAGDHQYRTAGEIMYDVLHLTEDDSRQRYTRASRAAQHMGTTAAATTPTAGGFGGLFITPLAGPVIDPYPAGMPFATALGMLPAPDSFSFNRPYISDPALAAGTGVAVQTLEKAELASIKFDVLFDTLTLVTVGGYLNISMQLLSLRPQSWDIIVAQMNKRLARAIETAVVAELSASTGTEELDAAATSAAVLQAIYNASAKVYAATGELATWILMGPLGWARLGGLADAAGRPMFPYLGAANAPGTAAANTFSMSGPAGLTAIVSPAVTDASFWVGNGLSIEGYIYRYPVLEAVEPSVLGKQIAVAASIVAARPTPTANAAVHIEDSVP